MRLYFSRYPACISILLLLIFAGCASTNTSPTTRVAPRAGGSSVSPTVTAPASSVSTARFTFSSKQNTSYTLRTDIPTSELRHGHREFTIILSDTDVSLFIVFYGYQGPGNYTLADSINGGDVHIGLKHDTLSWDLLMQPSAHCALTVSSDIPTSSAGLDRMRGTFSCPLLLSSSPNNPQKPIVVSNGAFDIAIQIAS